MAVYVFYSAITLAVFQKIGGGEFIPLVNSGCVTQPLVI